MDSSWSLTQMTKVEVVVAGDDVSGITGMFSEVGATGIAAVAGVSGRGHRGYRQGRPLFKERSTPSMLAAAVPNRWAGTPIEAIQLLPKRHSEKRFVSDTSVSRPEPFQ